ncbi:hypothetical protein OG883_29115 [Streptomyces sp. NBC_01142]|uniref:hypothetical protein n=1 Tax=Streptomyces sp. NBC_01142 TaxID=2975865 RepID=UPI00225A5F5A|nr:hypothetical protein [Streptomyces sp. NBC_01142]MCX4823863.1 hypothetical protein [Streptomyces sp. NBC_01142]
MNAPTGRVPALLLALLLSLWRRAAGRTTGGIRPTAAFLRRRMLVLPALAVVALALSAAAYSDVHGRTERLRDRSAPALVDLAQARTSLELAQKQAELRLLTAKNAGLVELGETYRSLLTEASQSLNRVAQSRALHKAQEQELRVVSGLVVAYGDKIAWADRHRTSKVLRDAGVDYAAELLGGQDDAAAGQDTAAAGRDTGKAGQDTGKAGQGTAAAGQHTEKAGQGKGQATQSQEGSEKEPTAILDRIEELEHQLRRENRDLAAWSPLTLSAAAAAALVVALFAVTTLGTWVFLRERLRLISVQLAVAALPVLVTPVLLAMGGAEEHGAQEQVRTAVGALERVGADRTAPGSIESAAHRSAALMREAHPDSWSLAAGIAVPAAGVGAFACGVTLFLYGRPYPAGRPRRKYTDA